MVTTCLKFTGFILNSQSVKKPWQINLEEIWTYGSVFSLKRLNMIAMMVMKVDDDDDDEEEEEESDGDADAVVGLSLGIDACLQCEWNKLLWYLVWNTEAFFSLHICPSLNALKSLSKAPMGPNTLGGWPWSCEFPKQTMLWKEGYSDVHGCLDVAWFSTMSPKDGIGESVESIRKNRLFQQPS